MEDNKQNKETKSVRNPLEHGMKTIDDIILSNEKRLKALTYISEVSIRYDEKEYLLPMQNKFFCQKWNRTFLVSKQKKVLKVKLAANFVVCNVKECMLVYNDKSGKKPLKYYVVTIINADNKVEKEVEILNNSKSDFKEFQSNINNHYNGFAVNMKEPEFKTFVAEFISPKVASNAIIYQNAGVVKEGFLYENALAAKNGIYFADEDGYIKVDEKSYIKIAQANHYLPKLFVSDKSGKQIANELMSNIKECWSKNTILPLLTLGHMVMSVFYEDFIVRHGVPTLILYGETGTGKSTLVTVGLSIFGLSKDSLTSGGSTAKSNEYFCSKYNGMNVCIDDVKGETLLSSNFTALIKGIYQGIPRTRSLPYGKGVEYIHTCSPLAYSTNEALPNLREVINRLNLIKIFGSSFEADKFNYHEFNQHNKDNLAELSLILPELLKYSKDDILELYSQVFNILKANVKDTQQRIINNIAYAYTGALMLTYISGVSFETMQQDVIEFAKKQIEDYESIDTPVERLLKGFYFLRNKGVFLNGTHYRLFGPSDTGGDETHLRFHRDTIILTINQYFRGDEKRQVDEKTFMDYLENHNRNRTPKGGITTRFSTQTMLAIALDVTDIEEAYKQDELLVMSAEDLRRLNT